MAGTIRRKGYGSDVPHLQRLARRLVEDDQIASKRRKILCERVHTLISDLNEIELTARFAEEKTSAGVKSRDFKVRRRKGKALEAAAS